MKRPSPPLLPLGPLAALTLLVFTLGASCDKKEAEDEKAPEISSGTAAASIDELPQVDVSELTAREKERWVTLVNDQLSPCGEPISVARCVAEQKACRACVPAARYLVRLVATGYEQGEIEEHYRLRFGRDSRIEVALEGAPVRGSPMAPVTILIFSDFECPHCGAAHPILQRLLREFEGRVKLIYRHFPLSGHLHAGPAARAAIAAQKQGKFWEMHDLLFENQDRLEPEDFDRYAEQLGLDLEKFREDLASEGVKKRVEDDRAMGERLEIEGTPTIFVNGHRFDEALPDLPAYVREELDQG